MKSIKFTREELKWIERTADIESSMSMLRFFDLVKSVNIEKLSEKEKEMIKKMSSEYIDLYLFLKELRTKLELWDCRFDIDTELKQKEKLK